MMGIMRRKNIWMRIPHRGSLQLLWHSLRNVQLILFLKITATPVDDKDEEIDPEIPELGLLLEDEDKADDEEGSDEDIDELDVDSL